MTTNFCMAGDQAASRDDSLDIGSFFVFVFLWREGGVLLCRLLKSLVK